MKQRIRGVFLMVLIAVLVSPCAGRMVYAGEINQAEQRIIQAVSGSFSYQGKTYVIQGRYIAEGRNKLAQDGVDLSDAEADSYIAQFHDSIAELVENGYCEETGDSTGEDPDSGETEQNGTSGDAGKQRTGNRDPQKADTAADSGKAEDTGEKQHSDAEKAQKELFIQAVLGKPEKTGEDQSAAATGRQDGNADAEWLEDEDLGTVEEFGDADLTAAKEQSLTVSDRRDQYRIHEGEQKGKTENILEQFLHLKQWKIASYVVLGFSLVTIGGMLWYILTVRRHRHKRRKLRLGLAAASGVSTAGCVCVLLFVLGLYFGIFNKDAIHRQLMESDYYSGVTQMTRRLASEKLQEAGYDEKIATEVFSLSEVYIEEKQYIDEILSGKKDSEVSVKTVESALKEQLSGTGEQEELIREISDIYRDTLQFGLGNMIWQNKKEFLPWCYGVMGGSVCLLLVLFGITYQMYGYLHKSVRVCAAGIFASSFLLSAVFGGLRLQGYAGRFHAAPVYYQQFIQKYVAWSVNVMLYVGCIGILVAVALTVWKRYLHMIYVE